MSFQIWADNETDQDLLGFQVHADLIRSVITDPTILPIILGVFGDWGGGKSSIMKMLQKDLQRPEYENVVCLYFNGWVFEGYEDAKTALLASILLELGEHKKFGPKLRGKLVSLLKRVKCMEVGKLAVKHVGVPLVAGLLTGGAGAAAVAVGAGITGLFGSGSSADSEEKSGDSEDNNDHKVNWAELVEKAPGKPEILEVRKFRDDFQKMLAETDISTLVILIDDLDRCLPERIIETLEAIKLFVAVPKTSFVIGADPRIVRHAIATRYVSRQLPSGSAAEDDQYDLVKDYLEKLIQVPYCLPRLSPAEIETYVNLLACQNTLEPEQFSGMVLSHWTKCRKDNLYAAYGQAAIAEALGKETTMPPDLLRRLAWSNAIADVVTEGLKGNPRQVKRMLNAMSLRKQLAAVAEIPIRDEVLAKIMVLEYSEPLLFRQLNDWQTADGGFPKRLKELEVAAIGDEGKKASDDGAKDWSKPTVQKWLRMQPALAEADLRDYFWLARDKTTSTLAGVNLVAPIIRRIFGTLLSGNTGEQNLVTTEALQLPEAEKASLLLLLEQQLHRHPDQLSGHEALFRLTEKGLPDAGASLIKAIRGAPADQLPPGLAFRLQTLMKSQPSLHGSAQEALEHLAAQKGTKIGKAAAQILQPQPTKH